VALDQLAVLDVRNLSPTEHPFHLHGMPFEVLSINGVAPSHQRLEDTLLLRIRDRARLLISADNPGDWMTHCHILPHAADGMMTMLRVE
jgi:FtsP/CotA-like multicopper oxidase with cupredoxin domain